MKGRFYVYVIYDPSSGRPVYVGKGQGRRDRDHQNDIARTNTDVVEFMTKCRAGGREAEIKREYEGLTEAEALQREIELIAKYGRKDNGKGVLLNRTDGGSGTSRKTGPDRQNRSAACGKIKYTPGGLGALAAL
jgi:hypothetical protein